MVNIKSAEFFIGIITFLMVYLISVTLANYARALSARVMGDDMPEQLGFLTLNPLVHIDPVGLSALFLFYNWGNYFGWGRYVPLNPFGIYEPFRTLKIIFVSLSNCLAHFLMALTGIVTLEIMFDVHILTIVRYMVLSGNMSHLIIAHSYPQYGSLAIVCGFILTTLVYFNVALGVFYFIINCRDIFIMLASDSPLAYEERRAQLSNIVIPMLLIVFFADALRHLIVNIMVYCGYLIAHILRII